MNRSQKKIKIFALPFAGGSKYSYRVLHDFVPAPFEWETIELPGRGSRLHEPLLSDINEITEDAFNQIRNRLNEGEYLIYGHSMGTLLGYELTKRIMKAGLNKPVCLFFTGRGAPAVKERKKISAYEKQAFWQEIKKLGGLPEEILENEEMKDFFEPFLRSDFKAVEEYQYQPMENPLPVPLFVRTGSEDMAFGNDIMKWQKETQHKLSLKILPGDHFFIFRHPEYIITQIVEAYKKANEMNNRLISQKRFVPAKIKSRSAVVK